MAYANLVDQSADDKAEIFCRMRDFICKRNGTYDYSTTGIGWTLIDSSYAVDEDNPEKYDWFVIYSPGEGGKDDIYLKVYWYTNFIAFYGYQSWNATTSTGSSNYYCTGNAWTTAESIIGPFWVYGDLDAFLCVHYLSSTDYRGVYAGKISPGYDDITGEIATCATTLTAGSDVSITVDSVPTEWDVDREIFIRTVHNDDMTTVECEKITIKTLVGDTITADLVNSYTADACLSDHVGYFSQNGTSFGTGNTLIGADGSLNPSTTVNNNTMTSSYFDPESYESRYLMLEYFQYTTKGMLGRMKNIRTCPTYGSTLPQLTYQDVLEDYDGVQWRTFKVYNAKYVAVKEV